MLFKGYTFKQKLFWIGFWTVSLVIGIIDCSRGTLSFRHIK